MKVGPGGSIALPQRTATGEKPEDQPLCLKSVSKRFKREVGIPLIKITSRALGFDYIACQARQASDPSFLCLLQVHVRHVGIKSKCAWRKRMASKPVPWADNQ